MARDKPKKERRRHKRSPPRGVTLTIDGQDYPTGNLSIGGSQIEKYDGPLSAGALLTITRIGDTDGTSSQVEIRSRVIRSDPVAEQLAVTFLELDAAAYEILQKNMAKRIEGLATKKP
ncbi:MAG: PilZ domain-containing protein [Rhodospirillales bacterium]|nr:PilZ domain-containing protein [Rhodospirillales bacterium]